MNDKSFFLVRSDMLPEIYSKVLEAKKLLTTGQVRSVSEAAKSVGISRGAFYKYKDAVYLYQKEEIGEIVTLFAQLQDHPGVLSNVIQRLYEAGANIQAVNQNIPVGGMASVSISVRVGNLGCAMEEVLHRVKEIPGVQSIEQIREQLR